MDRREFGKLVLGSGVAAVVPVQGLAGAAVTQAQRSKYIFAVALAHNRVDVSAEMISEMFNVRPHTARGFIAKMVRNGVVDAPNADGIARLAKPLQRIMPEVVAYNPTGGYTVKGPLKSLKEKAAEIVEEALRTEPNPAETEDINLSDDDPARPEVSGAGHSAE